MISGHTTPALRGFFVGLIFAVFGLIPIIATSAEPEELLHLSQTPEWKALLHFEKGEPSFISDSFYLTKTHTPLSELTALIKLANTPIKNEKKHPRCRFPARYAWLSERLQQPQWKSIPLKCKKLHKWIDDHRLTGVSIMLVSGYMGNPASLFGHTFLKLRTEDQEDMDLWQTSFSYGAKVPPNEHILRYVYKGLTGGYQATYSDRYFYMQDLTYTRTEARDMWEYPIKLSTDQLHKLQLHIWEVTNQQKRYYFLTHNCAYEIGKLLEGALHKPHMRPSRFWYLPEELVNQTHSIHLTGAPKYHPASERTLIWHYTQLPPSLKKRARLFMKRELNLKEILSGLDTHKKKRLLDFLVAYQHFLTMQQLPNPTSETKNLRHKLILERLKLPPSNTQPHLPPVRTSPLEKDRPSTIWGGLYSYQSPRLVLGGSPYSHIPEGNNILEGDELTMLWAEASIGHGDIHLEKLDYIRIMHHALSPLPKSSPWSWRLLLRSERLPQGKYDHQGHFGAGKSKKYGHVLNYIFLTPSIHSAATHVRVRLETGSLFEINKQTRLSLTFNIESSEKNPVYSSELKTYQAFSNKLGWGLEIKWRSDYQNTQLFSRIHWRF